MKGTPSSYKQRAKKDHGFRHKAFVHLIFQILLAGDCHFQINQGEKIHVFNGVTLLGMVESICVLECVYYLEPHGKKIVIGLSLLQSGETLMLSSNNGKKESLAQLRWQQ